MQVIKSNGQKQDFNVNKIITRVKNLSSDLDIDAEDLAKIVYNKLFDGISTSEIDECLAKTCHEKILQDTDYNLLGGRILLSRHKKGIRSFSETTIAIQKKLDIFNSNYIRKVEKYSKELDAAIDHTRDYKFGYIAYSIVAHNYLIKINKIPVECPQYMFMREAITVSDDNVEDIIKTYNYLSNFLYTHATPTIGNAGYKNEQLASCFLPMIASDSMESILDANKEFGMMSKFSGGVGFPISNIRAKNSRLKKSNGYSKGVIPMLKMFESTALYVDQGGRRPGAFSPYLETWHADIEDFVESPSKIGDPRYRIPDMFPAVYLNSIFMKKVKSGEPWFIFSPDDCPELFELYDDHYKKEYKFTEAYEKLVQEKKYRKIIDARDLWYKIVKTKIETGFPYIVNKDEVNTKSNQKNIGTIKSSNLCIEITEVALPDESPVCTLVSMPLPSFIRNGVFDFVLYGEVVRHAVKQLNNVIDINHYTDNKCKKSNLRHRPMGIGSSGLADVFMILGIPFDSPRAIELNKQIAECRYYNALYASMTLAKQHGKYETFDGSPASKGILQFHMWGVSPSNEYNWDELTKDIVTNGLRNSLLIAQMPTGTTSSIFDVYEANEPPTENIVERSLSCGNFVFVNKYLVKKLKENNLWTDEIAIKILSNQGSISGIKEIPTEIQNVFKTVYEVNPKTYIDMAADRGAFICQSESFNIYYKNNNIGKISNLLMYGFDKNLKSIAYYLRTPKNLEKGTSVATTTKEAVVCSLDNKEACAACSS